MTNVGVVAADLILHLEKITSPINAVPFQSALVSCGLVLDATEFEEIFQGMAKFNQANSIDVSIELDNVHELRRLSDKYIGQEGTRWKMYVSQIHQQQLLHNVAADKKIFEKNIKRQNIRQMVVENMQDQNMCQARIKHSNERRTRHKAMLEHYAAKSLQSMYYHWRGNQTVKQRRWIVERRALFKLRARQAGAASLIQRRFRSRHL